MTSWYAAGAHASGLPDAHPVSPGTTVIAPLALPATAVVGVLVGVRLPGPPPVPGVVVLVVGATALFAVSRRARASSLAVLAAVVVMAAMAGARSWADYHDITVGPVDGWASVMADPVEEGNVVHVVLEVDGERFDVWARGSPGRRLARTLAGDVVAVVGERRVPDDRPSWWRPRHLVGRLTVERVGDIRSGPPAHDAANRVRRQLELGARTMLPADRALFTGFVVGDDRAVDDATVQRFRAAGLAHLTAVSGQNVALLLAVASPLLRRLGPWWRWSATLALIGWFALLTRFEPSVLRASAMAAVAATAFVTGRARSGVGVLAVALTGLVIVDPMLVWSVGFWLSAAATAGLAVAATPLTRLVPGPSWWRNAVAPTLAAQLGVLPVAGLVFGLPSVVGLAANLLAVPVAGAVMLVGFPCAMAASLLPDALATAVMAPCTAGVRWVALVADGAARTAPSPGANVVAWLAVFAALAVAAVVRRRAATNPAIDDPE